MKIIAVFALVGASMPFAGAACAQNMYLGLSVTTPGEVHINSPSAQHVKNSNNPLGMKLEGGINLSNSYALEVGYGLFGTWKVADPAPGSTREVRSSATLLYVAGKRTFAVSGALSLFGNLGIATNRFKLRDGSQVAHSSFVRPMIGFGADYAITKNIGVELEYNYYGVEGHFRQQKLELGMKFRF